jgi:RNA-directed DNA polymerase
MTGDALWDYLKTHGPPLRAALLAGSYAPQLVRRAVIPKAGGGTRNWGIPTGLGRFIEQALVQVLQEEWDPTFSERSDGFRPQRNAHQAVAQAQAYIRQGDSWVVDIALEQCCDRVNHDVLRSRVRRRVQDRRVVTLTHRLLNAGVVTREGASRPRQKGPRGGGRCRPCSQTCCWTSSTRSWSSAGTGSPATRTRRTFLCGVGRQGNASRRVGRAF